jgi:hypothetical protein
MAYTRIVFRAPRSWRQLTFVNGTRGRPSAGKRELRQDGITPPASRPCEGRRNRLHLNKARTAGTASCSADLILAMLEYEPVPLSLRASASSAAARWVSSLSAKAEASQACMFAYPGLSLHAFLNQTSASSVRDCNRCTIPIRYSQTPMMGSRGLRRIAWQLPAPVNYFVGVDLGKVNDFTAIAVVKRTRASPAEVAAPEPGVAVSAAGITANAITSKGHPLHAAVSAILVCRPVRSRREWRDNRLRSRRGRGAAALGLQGSAGLICASPRIMQASSCHLEDNRSAPANLPPF